tara:strand:- start:105 stop:299 length:195 start_codon:yes stop_codon:yes gene_type:complete
MKVYIFVDDVFICSQEEDAGLPPALLRTGSTVKIFNPVTCNTSIIDFKHTEDYQAIKIGGTTDD